MNKSLFWVSIGSGITLSSLALFLSLKYNWWFLWGWLIFLLVVGLIIGILKLMSLNKEDEEDEDSKISEKQIFENLKKELEDKILDKLGNYSQGFGEKHSDLINNALIFTYIINGYHYDNWTYVVNISNPKWTTLLKNPSPEKLEKAKNRIAGVRVQEVTEQVPTGEYDSFGNAKIKTVTKKIPLETLQKKEKETMERLVEGIQKEEEESG